MIDERSPSTKGKGKKSLSPLVIYLDTSDYINIREHGDDAEISRVVECLKSKTIENKLTVVYSPMIILEFLTRPGEGYYADRIERGRVLKNICGLNTFTIEFQTSKRSFRNDGNWLGEDLHKALPIKDILKNALKSVRKELLAESQLNRGARRKLKSDSYVLSQMRSANIDLFSSRADFGSIPVSEEFLKGRYIEKYLKGQISEAAVQQGFTKWITDPEEFCRIFYEYKGNENAIDKFFASTISALKDSAMLAKNLCSQMIEFEKSRIQLRQNLIKAGLDSKQAKQVTPSFRPSLDLEASRTKIEGAFGVGRSEHFLAYMTAIFTGKTSWLSSDFGDLFHFTYSYDCDLFRCDKKMASIMIDCESLKDRLVGSFSELPNRIEAMLVAKG